MERNRVASESLKHFGKVRIFGTFTIAKSGFGATFLRV